ncbi:MAG: hypothetical protein MRJ92_08110 [Nitrospira sp.]|nr:hypothetical protein [Nitrospira sp.]
MYRLQETRRRPGGGAPRPNVDVAALTQQPGRLDDIVEDGRQRATAVSSQTMARLREAMKI